MGFSYNVNVLNQKGSPALYTDIFANRPAAGYAGRLFIANDTSAIYEDTGTAWVLIANVSSGAGTLQQVTTNGNTSNVGISITAGGLSTNSLTDTALTLGSVLFAGAAGLVTQDNAAFYWDDTNNRLGINTVTPGNSLDVHSSGTNPILALNNTAGNQSAIVFSNTGTNKWRIGNSSTNTFDVYNNVLGYNAITIGAASNSVQFLASIKIQQGAGFQPLAGYNGIGCDSAGFFFQLGTSTNYPYFAFGSITAGRTYTYPDATGTIALTSDLSAYLLKTGGTLTGNLNGTSALFSSTITSQANESTFGAAGSTGRALIIQSGSTNQAIKLLNAAGGDGTIFATGTSTTLNYVFDTYSVANALTIQNSGQVLIGTTTGSIVSASGLVVNDPIVSKSSNSGLYTQNRSSSNFFGLYGNTNLIVYNSDVGTIGTFAYNTGVYTPSSDINKKKDFEISTIGLNAILKLKPTLYRMLDEENTKKHLGFIAQEVKDFIPEAYVENGDGKDKFIGLDYQAITSTLVKAMQEQQSIINGLLKRIELLENK